MNYLACVACGEDRPDRVRSVLQVKEMMLGLRDEFDYQECGACGTVQLVNPPHDFGRYYPKDEYYSFAEQVRPVDTGLVMQAKRFGARTVLRFPLPLWFYDLPHVPASARWFRGLGLRLDSAVLDVGTGGGSWLHGLASMGFTDLRGVDPFVAESKTFENGVRIDKGEVSDVDGNFDLVLFSHSLEHMADPVGALTAAGKRLKRGGVILVRIPMADSWAFRRYQANWVQLDAPRHQFVPTRMGMELLARRSDFAIASVFYDSHAFGLFASDQYERNIPLTPKRDVFTSEEMAIFARQAKDLNQHSDGDQAVFVLSRQLSGAS